MQESQLPEPRTVQPHSSSFAEIKQMAVAVASSGMFGMKTPEQALTLMLLAQAEGMHPITAARDYHIITGKPAKKAEAMMRDFLRAGGKVEWHALDDLKASATFTHEAGGEATISWSIEDAKRADLMKNPTWSKYPRQMLRSRVVSEGIRTVFPMATSGMYVEEEVSDFKPQNEKPPTVDVDQPPEPPKPSGKGPVPVDRTALKSSDAPKDDHPQFDAPEANDEAEEYPGIDGEGPEPAKEPDLRLVTPDQTVRLWTIAKGKDWSEEQIKIYLEQRYKIASTRALNRDQYDEFISVVESKKFNLAFAALMSAGSFQK